MAKLDWQVSQAGTKCRVASARESERNVVNDMSQHDGCEGSPTAILVVMVRAGCYGVCACVRACSSVASFASEHIN